MLDPTTFARTFRAAALLVLLALGAGQSDAFPGFARKYSPTSSLMTFMPCAGCHDTFPKLTPFGRRFKEAGFRMDGDDTSWKDTLRAFPIALRSTAYSTGIGSSDGSTFGVLKPIAAGTLGGTVSFWFEQPFYVYSDRFERRQIDYAWVGFYNVLGGSRSDLLNVRGGSFELDLPFPQARTHNLFAYEPYFLAGGDPDWSLATPQRGVEVSGRPFSWGRYSVAIADSVQRSADRPTAYDPDVYARFAADLAVTHRVGAFYYDGRNELLLDSGNVDMEHQRLGADFDLRFPGVGASVYGLYLLGRDRAFGEAFDSDGGFVQAEKLARSWLLLTSRYTYLRQNEWGVRDTQQSFALGAQAWFLERLKFTFEYRFQKGERRDEGIVSFDFVL
jgi:hypothetical protein